MSQFAIILANICNRDSAFLYDVVFEKDLDKELKILKCDLDKDLAKSYFQSCNDTTEGSDEDNEPEFPVFSLDLIPDQIKVFRCPKDVWLYFRNKNCFENCKFINKTYVYVIRKIDPIHEIMSLFEPDEE